MLYACLARRSSVPVLLALFLVSVSAGAQAGRAGKQERLESADSDRSRAEDSADSEAYKQFQFGTEFYRRGLLRESIDAFDRALAAKPAYPEAGYMLAVCYLELNDIASAVRAAENALQINPLFTEAHNVLGQALARRGQRELALKEFQIVLSDISFPTPEVAHFNVGRLAWEQQGYDEAVLHFRRAIELNPEWGRAWYMMGDCQESLGQLDEAKRAYAKAVDLMPHEVGPKYRLGLICFKSADMACARQYFEMVRTDAPGSDMAAGAREYLHQIHFR